MNLKKAITVITAVAILSGSLVACSADSSAVDADAEKTSAVSQQETTAKKSSEIPNSSEASTVVSENEESTTSKNSESTTAKEKTTASSSVKSTTKKATQKTTAKKTTTKKTSNKSTAKTTAKKTTVKNTTTATTTTTTEAEKEIKINLTKNGNAECKSSNVTIGHSGIEGTVYIEKGGDYVITSSTDEWHGQIVIKLANTESANIKIENVNITSQKANVIKILDTNITAERSFIEADLSSSTAGVDTDNALRDEMKEVSKNDKAPNVDLSFPTGTSSSFSTGANSLSGVIYNESKLTIKGNGSVSISATKNRNNAICSTKSITFKNVTANLSTAANDSPSALSSARGIFTFSKVYVESGNLNIKSNGDGIRCEEFNSSGGKSSITSSAADGVDADDAINITGGNVTVIALDKSCFKVRRINNQEKIDEKLSAKPPLSVTEKEKSDGVTKTTHTFKIDGGTVMALGKNITTVQKVSKQASITCRSVKSPGSDEAKKAINFTIKGTGVNVTSPSTCIKYFYSSPSIDVTKEYTVSSSGYTSQKVTFSGTVGDVRIEANR